MRYKALVINWNSREKRYTIVPLTQDIEIHNNITGDSVTLPNNEVVYYSHSDEVSDTTNFLTYYIPETGSMFNYDIILFDTFLNYKTNRHIKLRRDIGLIDLLKEDLKYRIYG